jgi:hypothetical protein
MLVTCYDPESGDAVVVEPATDPSVDPANPPAYLGTSQRRKLYHQGEYECDDDPNSWPLAGPCNSGPTA